MPSKVNVRVKGINHTTTNSQAGDQLNWIEITGFDNTNDRGFKKRFFSTKKDGTATKNAEMADTLVEGDWIELTLDDTSYNNVQTLRKISEPAGAPPASNKSAGSSNPSGGGGSSDKMSKAEWAAKQARESLSMARHKALLCATTAVSADGKGFTAAKMASIKKAVPEFTNYLVTGDFEGVIETPAVEEPKVETPPVQTEIPIGDAPETVTPDDDIPF